MLPLYLDLFVLSVKLSDYQCRRVINLQFSVQSKQNSGVPFFLLFLDKSCVWVPGLASLFPHLWSWYRSWEELPFQPLEGVTCPWLRELRFLGFEGVIFSWLWGNYVSMALKELPFHGWSCEGVTFLGHERVSFAWLWRSYLTLASEGVSVSTSAKAWTFHGCELEIAFPYL